MFLQLKILTKDYKFVLDTGSAVTIISSVVYNEKFHHMQIINCVRLFRTLKSKLLIRLLLGLKELCLNIFKCETRHFIGTCMLRKFKDGLIGLDFLKDKYSRLLGVIILLCNSPVTLLFLQRKYPISYR